VYRWGVIALRGAKALFLVPVGFLLAGGGWEIKNGRKVMVVAKLTAKQQRFCDEYLIDLNATQAAIRAGYSEKTAAVIATENLRKPNIQEYIEKRMSEKEEELIAKQDEVLKYLTEVMRREKSEHVVVTLVEEKSYYALDEDGKMRKRTEKKEYPQIIKIPARLSDSNKAAELLGKRYSLFTDKVDVDGAVPVVITGGEELED
jgi:phage terminase small subunit